MLPQLVPIGRVSRIPATTILNAAKAARCYSAKSKVTDSATSGLEFKRAHPRQLRPLPRVPTPTAEQAVSNLLYNTPTAPKLRTERHILDCLAQDEPGVLSRVTGIMAARGFNIDSLVASRTEVPGLSRMTIVLKGPADYHGASKETSLKM